MNRLTAADYADTGQWRLLIKICRSGMGAYLQNLVYEDIEPQKLFDVKWEENEENRLAHIENAVYDHPAILEDYATRLTLYDADTLFIPTAFCEEDEGLEEQYYNAVYEGNIEDLFIEKDKDITAIYRGVSGLKSFILRTFPGARVESHLMAIIKRERAAKGSRMYVDVRDKEADFVLLDDENLLSASTHQWKTPNDVAYHISNILDVYGFHLSDVKLEIRGLEMEELGFIC